jgi:hypothetical protein
MVSEAQHEQPLTFGFQDEWKAFQERHAKFFDRWNGLTAVLDKVYVGKVSKTGTEAIVIYMLSRLCFEEFNEILTLAANGYGIGALKLLRSLYERAVTMLYLSDNPNDTDAFINYYHVAQHKLLTAIRTTFGDDAILAVNMGRVKGKYEAVKENYMITDCKKCATKRLNHTWHTLDVVAMAKKTSLAKLTVQAYYEPMIHAHSTVRALLSRMEETGEDSMGFKPDAQRKEADRAFCLAHRILLNVVGKHIDYFELDASLQQFFETCIEEFKYIWGKTS